MSLISQHVKNLSDGVSQMPPEERLESQAEEQINHLTFPGKGVIARPGFKWVNRLRDLQEESDKGLTSPIDLSRAYIHTIDISPTERYYLVLALGHISLWDAFTGQQQFVELAEEINYLEIPEADVLAPFDLDLRTPWRTSIKEGGWWQSIVLNGMWVWAFWPQSFADYRFGPGSQYKFIKANNIGSLPDLTHQMGVQQAEVLPAPPPNSYAARNCFLDCTYAIPHRDQMASLEIKFNAWDYRDQAQGVIVKSGVVPTGLSYIAGLRLRQEPYGGSDGQAYILDLGYNPDTGHWQLSIGLTTSNAPNSYAGIGTPAEDIGVLETERWYEMKFVATNVPGSNDVLLRGYLDGNLKITRTHQFSSGATLQNPGVAGFHLAGVGVVDAPQTIPSIPQNVVPAGGTYFRNFTIGSQKQLSDVVPFGLSPYKALTIGEDTLILNTLAEVKSAGPLALSESYIPQALVSIRHADYNTKYTVVLNGQNLTYTTGGPGGTTISGDIIAVQVAALINAAFSGAFQATAIGSVVLVKRDDNANFRIEVFDGLGDKALYVIKDKAQRFEDLPLWAPDGYVVEVIGDPGSEYDNYWVRYEAPDASGTPGYWKETLAPSEEYQFNRGTLPFVLKRKKSGTWQLGPGPWEERKTGSSVTNPFPSFVGHQIRDMFFEQQRLGFLSEDKVILSEAGNIYNFFRHSAKQLLDSDPIDVAESGGKNHQWQAATHWNERLVLWSPTQQVYLEGEPALTPRTVSFRECTAHEFYPSAAPRVIGNRIFFPQVVAGGLVRVGEMYVPQFTGKPTAIETTRVIPNYIQGDPYWMAGADQPNLTFVLSMDSRSTIYVHSWTWASDTKVQSSWSKWTMPSGSTLVALDYYRGRLAAFVWRTDGLHLEVADLSEVLAPQSSLRRLDRRILSTDTGVTATVENTASETETRWELPFEVYSGESWTVRNAGTLAVIPTTLVLDDGHYYIQSTGDQGDLTAVPMLIGQDFQTTYTLSRIFWRKGPDRVAETDGRLRLGYLTFRGKGPYTVTVTSPGRSPYTYTNSSNLDEFSIPVMLTTADATISVTYSGLEYHALHSFEWEATFSSRRRRV